MTSRPKRGGHICGLAIPSRGRSSEEVIEKKRGAENRVPPPPQKKEKFRAGFDLDSMAWNNWPLKSSCIKWYL